MLELNTSLSASGVVPKGQTSVSASPGTGTSPAPSSDAPASTKGYLQAEAANAPKASPETKVAGDTKSADQKVGDTTKKSDPANLADRLQKAADEIQKFMPNVVPNTQLQIVQDKATNLFVYKSIDKTTGKTVHQFPAEEVLKFISFFREKEGLVVDSKV